mmetsp:Transcript_21459/g.31916  ORF Transcript_21459/g.31916 Transcript_21459/m.31916 type:complete len:294 (+) Transcript_21459:329-1210(+)
MTTKDGLVTNGLFGFCRILLTSLEHIKPSHAACVLEGGGDHSTKLQIYPSYKANRKSPDSDLAVQFGHMAPLSEGIGIKALSKEGYEADDVIATLVKKAIDEGFEDVVILSNDKDLLQLVSEEDSKTIVRIIPPKTAAIKSISDAQMDAQRVYDKLGVWPKQVPDYLALVGDSSDNIPGVPSIGPKSAQSLLQNFASVEEMHEVATDSSIEEFPLSKSRREEVAKHRDRIEMNLALVRLCDDLSIPDYEEIDDLRVGLGLSANEAINAASKAVDSYEFASLKKTIKDCYQHIP